MRTDLDECLRLCFVPAIRHQLDTDAHQKRYINGTIQDTKVALAGIGKYVESVRTDEDRNGEISLHTRFEWMSRHQYKLQSRQAELDTCRKSLLQAMSRLTLFSHVAGERNGLPSYVDATYNEGGRVDTKLNGAKFVPDDELLDFLTTRQRRSRPVEGKRSSEPRTDVSLIGKTY